MSADQNPTMHPEGVMEPVVESPFESLPLECSEEGTEVLNANQIGDDLAATAVLRKTLNIMESKEVLPDHIIYDTIKALAEHGKSRTSTVQHEKQSRVDSLGNEYGGRSDLLEIEPLLPNCDWSMIPKENEDKSQHNHDESLLMEAMLGPESESEQSAFKNINATKNFSHSGIQQMPWTTETDFITTNFDPKGNGTSTSSSRGGNAKSDAASAAKSKGDLRSFSTFADYVESKWKQDSYKEGLSQNHQMIQGSHQQQFLDSLRQFVEHLKGIAEKENSEDAKLKFKFSQYKRVIWVLDNIEKRSSIAEIGRMLILCNVVVGERGTYKRKRN